MSCKTCFIHFPLQQTDTFPSMLQPSVYPPTCHFKYLFRFKCLQHKTSYTVKTFKSSHTYSKFSNCFLWSWNKVFHSNGKTQITSVWTQSAQEKRYELSEKFSVLHKKELFYLYGSSDITCIVKSRRMWWLWACS